MGVEGFGAMPIQPLLDGASFSPDDIKSITVAFEASLRALGLADRKDPAVTLLAKRMIELARDGERDPVLLQDAVLQSLRNDPGVSGL